MITSVFAHDEHSEGRVAEALATVAAQTSAPQSRFALARLLRTPCVTAPIVGASRPSHFQRAMVGFI